MRRWNSWRNIMSYIEVVKEVKKYTMGDTVIAANDGVSFSVEKGEIALILGPSGAGKSTVLNILGGMDQCDSGKVIVDGTDIAGFDAKQLTTYRRKDVGFVFQFYNLVPNLTARENVELSAQIVPEALDAAEILTQVGLGDRLDHFPAQLSGGEQQRVTIARAIAKKPKLLLCDEPTGALDYETGKQILAILEKTARETGTTVLIITHNSALAPMADRVIHINDAKVRKMEKNTHPIPIASISW
ncbi:ABC transporter [Enterococcus casseliflavus EC30]|nr:ABC transporter [Enterococcus casseliflavus EC30]EEV37292.1 ABC transporter [Enterococcus casseliflavus EC10]